MRAGKLGAAWRRLAPATARRLPARPCGLPARLQAARTRGSSRRVLLHAAASDEKQGPAGPMYLSDLIAFESDDAGSPRASGSSLDGSSSSSSSLAGSLGLATSSSAGSGSSMDADPTQRAQEIINRATEVLAAARAALANPAAPDAAAAEAAPPSAGSSSAAAGSRAAVAPPPQVAQQQQQQQAASAAAPASSGPGGSRDGGSGGAEPLTRRWSALSEDQDLTRHVLQSALDQMQRAGVPIAAPADPPAPPAGGSSLGAAPPGGSVLGASAAASAAAAGGGVKRAGSRDIRSSGGGGGGSAGQGSSHAPPPSWAQSLLGPDDFGDSGSGLSHGLLFPSEPGRMAAAAAAAAPPMQLARAGPQLQPAPAAASAAAPAVFEDAPLTLTLPPAVLGLASQAEADAARARAAVLPPLQSVVELTTAFRPPERSGGVAAAAAVATADAEAEAAAVPAGRALADGRGRLADGTWWEKQSGIEYGKNGYWKRWQLLKGGNAEGTLEWEETWWEASDWTGLKEMGAEKKGKNTDGDAWRESWSERLMYASNDLDCVVERNAHKWAAEANGDEWEERWGEHYHAGGKVAKYADKWGKAGPNVWHERWGEDYDASQGDACVKWTDKWAERLLPGGAREQWGDKWHESFAGGRGEKNGEVWSVGAGGDRYQRWWGEQHMGDQRVRRHGHSTSGEAWDDVITMDTYYNPVPHFGFKHALSHSPQLRGVPLQPKAVNADDPFGPGLDAL